MKIYSVSISNTNATSNRKNAVSFCSDKKPEEIKSPTQNPNAQKVVDGAKKTPKSSKMLLLLTGVVIALVVVPGIIYYIQTKRQEPTKEKEQVAVK